MKIVAIIQARMTSTRLPGKVLKKVMNKTLLEYQLERVSRSKYIDEIVVATTENKVDDSIVEICNQLGYSIFRGSEEDVLSRYYQAAHQIDADMIVRLTSDCPIIDPAVIDKVIELFLQKHPTVDYVSNTLERTFPRGMDTEVFSMEILREANSKAKKPYEREHVTPFIYLDNIESNIYQYVSAEDYSNYRLTVDTIDDFELIKILLERLYKENERFTLEDIIELLKQNPQLSNINSHVEQKKLGE